MSPSVRSRSEDTELFLAAARAFRDKDVAEIALKAGAASPPKAAETPKSGLFPVP